MSMISKYSNSYDRKVVLHVFMVLLTVHTLHKTIRKRKFELSCLYKFSYIKYPERVSSCLKIGIDKPNKVLFRGGRNIW